MGMIVVNILILMLFIAALLGFWHLKQSTEKSYKNLLNTKNSLEEQVKSYKNETKNLQNLHIEDNNQILKLTENLAEIQVSYLELERKLENDSNLAKVKEELDRLNGIVNDSVAYIDKLNDEIKTKNDLLTNTIAAQHASEGAQEKIAREIERLRVELNNVEVLLKQRKEIMRRSTLEGIDLNLFTLDLKPKERRIIELIQGLKVECVELSEDLANIE